VDIEVVMITVILNDTGMTLRVASQYFRAAAAWAEENCESFVTYEVQDVSDFSVTNDLMCEYQFGDDQDVVLFQLRWK
jgi:hypothetical protein